MTLSATDLLRGSSCSHRNTRPIPPFPRDLMTRNPGTEIQSAADTASVGSSSRPSKQRGQKGVCTEGVVSSSAPQLEHMEGRFTAVDTPWSSIHHRCSHCY